jgi:hypothetical protein
MKRLPREEEDDLRESLNIRFNRMRKKKKDCSLCWRRRTCSQGLRVCRRCYVESKIHAARFDVWKEEHADQM